MRERLLIIDMYLRQGLEHSWEKCSEVTFNGASNLRLVDQDRALVPCPSPELLKAREPAHAISWLPADTLEYFLMTPFAG